MSQLENQLAAELAAVAWRDLVSHARRDALIVVSESLDLLEVGSAIAGDQVPLVQDWISSKLIFKPTTEDLGNWNLTPDKLFNTLIVQPFVLVQLRDQI
ncbi:MAG: DUF2288 family protein [Chlorogloea purpurea SAG 13.99]|nr:DUF2288 family protein [Chlorogloea purpurea SAG 13.99]